MEELLLLAIKSTFGLTTLGRQKCMHTTELLVPRPSHFKVGFANDKL